MGFKSMRQARESDGRGPLAPFLRSLRPDLLGLELRYRCDCSGTLDVIHDLSQCGLTREILDARLSSKDPLDRSGVWRFRELILPLGDEKLQEIAAAEAKARQTSTMPAK